MSLLCFPLYCRRENIVIARNLHRSKSREKKLGFAAVFADIPRRGVLPQEASIHTAEMTAIREIQKREDM